MREHLLPADLDRILSGGPSRDEFKWTLRHLTDCADCRKLFQQLKGGRTDPWKPAPERRLDDRVAEVQRLEMPDKVRLLLEESYALRYRDTEGMIEMAAMARDAVERLEPEPEGQAAHADLRARVWAELGNAYRVGDDLFAADEALKEAITWARRGSGDLQLACRITDLTASLFYDQRRFSEACEVSRVLQEIYEERGEEHLAGRALISRGIFAGHAGKPEKGIDLIFAGLERIDPGRDPKLLLTALHALVFNLVEAQQYNRARFLLWRLRPLYHRQKDRLNLVRMRWLEGKIYVGLGDARTAEQYFQEARKSLKEYGQHYDWALCSLDLAMLWALQGRRDEARKLARTLIASFRSLRIAREAIASLLVFCDWSCRPYVPNDILHDKLEQTSMLLNELDRQPPRRRRKPPAARA